MPKACSKSFLTTFTISSDGSLLGTTTGATVVISVVVSVVVITVVVVVISVVVSTVGVVTPVITTTLFSASHCVVPPKPRATYLAGARVLPSIITGVQSIVATLEFIYNLLLPTCITTFLPPLLPVIFFVAGSQVTFAPQASKISLTGTIVLPPITVGGTSVLITVPSISRDITFSEYAETVGIKQSKLITNATIILVNFIYSFYLYFSLLLSLIFLFHQIKYVE